MDCDSEIKISYEMACNAHVRQLTVHVVCLKRIKITLRSFTTAEPDLGFDAYCIYRLFLVHLSTAEPNQPSEPKNVCTFHLIYRNTNSSHALS